MAITDKKTGPWGLDQVYNKINQGSIWNFSGQPGLWVSGSGSQGISAQNDTVNRSSPIQIPGTTWSTDLGKIAVTPYNNRYHIGAIKTDNTLWVWGKNTDGTLGLNDKTSRSSPTQLPGSWTTVSASYESFLGQKTDGTLWTWGFNDSGSALGHNQSGYPASVSSPKQVGSDTTWAPGGVMSKENGMVAKTDGTLWMWGKNYDGLLGQNESYTPSKKGRSSPVQVGSDTTWGGGAGKLGMTNYGSAAAAIKTDGTLWCWGDGGSGKLGQNDTTQRSSPIQVGDATTWKYIMHNGQGMFMATKTDNTLWAWGGNSPDYKLLGMGDTDDRSAPIQLPGTTWNRPNAVGYRANVISKTDGTLWATGKPAKDVIGLNGTGHANPGPGSPIQCGGDGWIEAKGSLYYMIGTAEH